MDTEQPSALETTDTQVVLSDVSSLVSDILAANTVLIDEVVHLAQFEEQYGALEMVPACELQPHDYIIDVEDEEDLIEGVRRWCVSHIIDEEDSEAYTITLVAYGHKTTIELDSDTPVVREVH